MSQRRPLPDPAENPQGEYIEAIYHALKSDYPAAALRFAEKALGPRRLIFLTGESDGS